MKQSTIKVIKGVVDRLRFEPISTEELTDEIINAIKERESDRIKELNELDMKKRFPDNPDKFIL